MKKPYKPITHEALINYSENSNCIICGKDHTVDYDNTEFLGGWVTQDAHCSNCGSKWKDEYYFQCISNITDKSGKTIGKGEYWTINWQAIVQSILKNKKILPLLLGINDELDTLIENSLK